MTSRILAEILTAHPQSTLADVYASATGASPVASESYAAEPTSGRMRVPSPSDLMRCLRVDMAKALGFGDDPRKLGPVAELRVTQAANLRLCIDHLEAAQLAGEPIDPKALSTATEQLLQLLPREVAKTGLDLLTESERTELDRLQRKAAGEVSSPNAKRRLIVSGATRRYQKPFEPRRTPRPAQCRRRARQHACLDRACTPGA